MNRSLALGLFILLTLGGGLLIGALTLPDAWFIQLRKPPFQPPGWVFGPVWSVLYVLIGIAGWRPWRLPGAGLAQKLWWLQLGLNFLWPPVFFGAHRLGLSVVVILCLLAAVLACTVAAWRRDKVAGLMLLPYLGWVSFASALNGVILALN